jgi:acyl-CoA synthetase (AMP-forming)/AMP-acid ligase II
MSDRFSSLLEHSPELPAAHVDGHLTTRGELLNASRVAAAKLLELGLGRGDKIAVWLPDGLPWLQLLFAAAEIGVLVVPISTRYKEVEVLHIVETARPRVLFIPTRFLDFDYSGVAQRVRASQPCLEHVVEVASQSEFVWAGERAGARLAVGEGNDSLCTFTTSGTTGKPKLAAHTQAGLAAHARNVADAVGLGGGDAVLCALPLYGVLGFVQAIAALSAGAACVMQPVYKAEEAAAAIERYAITHFYGADAMLDQILRVPGRSLASWRGGGFAEFAGLGAQVVALAEQKWNLRLIGIYGMSECLALAAIGNASDAPEIRGLAGGNPVAPGVQFRISDPDTGFPLAIDQEGELQLRGYNVMREYLNNPAATAEAFTADGWLRTGDLAVRQGAGFTYRARLRDSLRLRGYLVDPSEIEEQLCRHASVASSQVVGVNVPGEGDVAVAFVITQDNVDTAGLEAQLVAHCKESIAGYKVPRRVLVVKTFPQVDGPNGVKVLKGTLRDMAKHELEQGAPRPSKETTA